MDAKLAPARPSTNDLLLWGDNNTKWQRAEITSVSGKILQLNATWVFGEVPPTVLAYVPLRS